ncbi:MAG: hypothetical protein LBF60_04710 [Treponema sp.]|jgi:hypothetical protein|nr:hypothetical protein [Treponema sp.]
MGVDWYPRSRDARIHLTDTWIEVFKTKATEWNIPASHANSLTAANSAAKEKLAVVKSGERTTASVVECNEIFVELEAEARFLKKHYPLLPPLDLADLAALLSLPPDETRDPVGKPSGRPALTLTYPGGRRKTELVEFGAADSGMTAFFRARYENQKGEHGAWGPRASAVIP